MKKLALLAATIVLVLLLAEAVVRVFGLAPALFSLRFGEVEVAADPGLGWINRPLAPGINSLGLRGPEPDAGPDAGRGAVRVLVLGDSVAYGYGLAEPECMPRRLEAHLRAAGAAAEVLNAGVNAYNTLQEAHWLRCRGLALKPSHVVLIYCLNDRVSYVERVPRYLAKQAAREGLEENWARAREVMTFGPVARSVLEWSHLARLAHAWLTRAQLPIRNRMVEEEFDLTGGAGDFSVVADGFAALAETCRAAGIDATVVIMPYLKDLARYPYLAQHQRVTALGQAAGLPVLDLLPVFAGERGSDLSRPGDPIHPSAAGADLAARAVAEHLLKRL